MPTSDDRANVKSALTQVYGGKTGDSPSAELTSVRGEGNPAAGNGSANPLDIPRAQRGSSGE